MTDHPTPSAELRTAAEKLRALAAEASTATATPTERGGTPTTRWHFTESEPGSGYLYAANPDGPGTRLLRTSGTGGRGHRDPAGMRTRHGEYAAAMDPAVGKALADWLDSAAEEAEHIGPDPKALAFARVFHGSQP